VPVVMRTSNAVSVPAMIAAVAPLPALACGTTVGAEPPATGIA
jgi:hypothetical protein